MRYQEILEACWKGYHKEGMKTMFGKRYPNCVKNKTTNEDQISNEKVRRIQNFLNSKFKANLDVDGVLGPLTIKSIEKFMPDAKKKLAPEPDRTTRVQGLEKKLDESDLEEDLRKWFKEKWVRFGPDGKIRGDCARGSKGEGKPKCLPQAKAHALGKKGRASAAARKRRQDPDADRKGAAKNVPTKESADLEEGWKEKMAAAAVAGGLALGAGSAQALDVDKYGMAKDVFGPSQDYAVHQPLKSIAVDMPNQWVKSKNVIVYDKMIFNPMSAEMYGKIKSSQAYKRDGEIVPAGTVPGVDGNIMLYTEGDYNYFLTGKMAKNYSQELATTDLVNRNLSTAQRYVQGDLKKSTAPKIQNFNPDISKKPTLPWQRNQDKNT